MATTKVMIPNIGIEAKNRQGICDNLSRVLADTYILYLKTQNYHWNVVGPQFPLLHTLFEKQYLELAEAIDEVAERIRALGCATPASFSEFTQIASIHEERGVTRAEDMVRILAEGHETLVRNIRSMMENIRSFQDEGTENLLAQHIEAHEKHAWMLRSTLG